MRNVSKIRYSYRYVTFSPLLLLLFMSENAFQLGTTLCAKLVEMCKQNRCQYLNPQGLRIHSGICLYEWCKSIVSFLPMSIWKISYFPFVSKVSKISYRYLELVYLWVSPILYLRYFPTLGLTIPTLALAGAKITNLNTHLVIYDHKNLTVVRPTDIVEKNVTRKDAMK